jgi:hypothetical protein
MNWTPEIVRSRFVEACDTERRLPLGGASSSGGYWPAYVHSFEDMNGWGTKRLAEEREMRLARTPPSAAAISRFDEVMAWSAVHIHDDNRRKIIWTWAHCQLTGHSFAERCRKFGWVKMTAYRRLHAVSDAISFNLDNAGALLRMPDEKWVLPEQPVSASNFVMVALTDDAEQPTVHPTFQVIDKPGDLLKSPEAVADFSKHLASVNRQRRKEQERRKKLGLDAA